MAGALGALRSTETRAWGPNLEKNRDDPEYFPAPLWISIRSGQKGELPMVGTWGLKHFGFLELWFLDAKSPWPELHEKLYLMSMFQITAPGAV